jgi:hypothetical protein
METVTVSPQAIAAAKEINRRRILMQKDTDLATATGEVAVLDRYGMLPSIADLQATKKRLDVSPTDASGRTIKIIVSAFPTYRVWSRMLDHDIYILVRKPKKTQVEIAGWIDGDSVQEAPVVWFEKDGEKVDYAHEVAPPFLLPLPTEFDFKPHPTDYGAIWDSNSEGWQCLGCDRYFYDSTAHGFAKREEEERRNAASGSTETSEGEEGY